MKLIEPDGHWFDEGRVEIIEPAIDPANVAGPEKGGPQRDAPSVR